MDDATRLPLGVRMLDTFRAVLRDVKTYDPIAGLLLADELESAWPQNFRDDFVPVAMSTFPKIGKAFDKALSSQMVNWELFGSFAIESVDQGLVIPVLDSLFWEHGGFISTARNRGWLLDPTKVFYGRQLLYMFKGYELPCPPEKVKAAVADFWDIESRIRVPRSVDTDLLFHVCGGEFSDGLVGDEPTALRRMVRCLDKIKRMVVGIHQGRRGLADLDPYDLLPNHGPGAVSDKPLDGDKYSFPTWPRVIEDMFPANYFTAANWRLYEERPICPRKHHAKLCAVPKDIEKPRLIASEPVVHQWLQQSLKKVMRDGFHPIIKAMVSIEDQNPSREAALLASRDGTAATIDLSSASDRMSLWAIESLFSSTPVLLEALVRVRTNHVSDQILTGEVRELRKFAHQGNATVFPVQSVLYALAALSASLVHEGRDLHPINARSLLRRAKRIRVYGDDIIVPVEVAPYLALILDFLGLKINSTKSHLSGGFRESCGMDAYRGYDVTPAYVSHSVPSRPGEDLVAFMEQSNNAHRKGLWHLAEAMKEEVELKFKADLLPVSSTDLGVAAFFTFCDGTAARKWRFNKDLHRMDVRGFAQKSRVAVVERVTSAGLLQYFTEEPPQDSSWHCGWSVGENRVKLLPCWVNAMVPCHFDEDLEPYFLTAPLDGRVVYFAR